MTTKNTTRAKKPRKVITRADIVAVFNLMGTGMTMTEACKKLKVQRQTVFEWKEKDATLGDAYARAREAYAEAKVSEMNDIAKTEKDVQRARLLCDNIKWQACKVLPKLYGDKVQVDATHRLAALSEDELKARSEELRQRIAEMTGAGYSAA